MSFGLSAGAIAGIVGAGASVYSASKSGKGGGGASGTQTTQQELDPRIASILFGENGSNGLLSQFQGYLNTPQSGAAQSFGNQAGGYLQNGAALNDLNTIRSTAGNLTGGVAAPRYDTPGVSNPLWAEGARVNAPSQNSIDTKSAFEQFIGGNEGANPYLTKALQSGVDQTNASYQKNQTDLTNNLQRNVLPGIDSNAIASGGFGGSRQGVAQGLALSDYTNQLNNSNLQIGLANSANTTGAQAQAFNQGRDRSLSALQGLSSQQYGLASQNAAMDQQTRLANQGMNTQYNLANQAAQLQTNGLNANSQLQTNAQNNAAGIAGAGLLSGTLGQLYGYSQNNDNYGINRAQQVSGLLSPYIGVGGSSTTTSQQPYYSNTVGNALGGAAAGLGLYNSFNQANNSAYNIPNAQNVSPYYNG